MNEAEQAQQIAQNGTRGTVEYRQDARSRSLHFIGQEYASRAPGIAEQGALSRRPVSAGAEEYLGVALPVLGDGFVRLVDYSGNDLTVVERARVSYGAGTRIVRRDEALIEYLMLHDHASPFGFPTLCFQIKLPIFVARQFYTHRASSRVEVSRRYSEYDPDEGCYVAQAADLCAQDTKNRQGRGEPLGSDAATTAVELLEAAYAASADSYATLLNGTGVAREIARQVLPVAAWTTIYWQQDLRNLLHFLHLRLDAHAQLETRRYAEVMARVVAAAYPAVWNAWYEHVHMATTLSQTASEGIARLLYAATQGETTAWDVDGLLAALEPRQAAQVRSLLDRGRELAGVTE